jgi:hypothetical protein
VVGYQHFRGPCCLHLQGEENGAGKKGIHISLEYNGGGGGDSPKTNRKQEGVGWQPVILAVGGG